MRDDRIDATVKEKNIHYIPTTFVQVRFRKDVQIIGEYSCDKLTHCKAAYLIFGS